MAIINSTSIISSRRQSTPSLCTLLLVTLMGLGIIIHAAPVENKQWIILLDNKATDAKSDVFKWYENNGMPDAESKAESIDIGSKLGMLAMPSAGGEEARLSLQSVSSVSTVARDAPVELFASTDAKNLPGLDRIDGKLDGVFNFSDNAQGKGVDIYVIDSGVDTKHSEFEGRATLVDLTGEGQNDLNGHGTHVSGTAAGKTFGIAKEANIIGVKVFDKGGSGSAILTLKALQFVAQNVGKTGRPSVINLSLGGKRTPELDAVTEQAHQALFDMGVAGAVAAGNEKQNACKVTPAFVSSVLTVGASDPRNDVFAPFSNVGQCVDVVAPGVNILSAKANTNSGSTLLSGTSMATPHVAGVLAAYMSTGLNNKQAMQKVKDTAQRGVIKGNLRGSSNLFLSVPGGTQ